MAMLLVTMPTTQGTFCTQQYPLIQALAARLLSSKHLYLTPLELLWVLINVAFLSKSYSILRDFLIHNTAKNCLCLACRIWNLNSIHYLKHSSSELNSRIHANLGGRPTCSLCFTFQLKTLLHNSVKFWVVILFCADVPHSLHVTYKLFRNHGPVFFRPIQMAFCHHKVRLQNSP